MSAVKSSFVGDWRDSYLYNLMVVQQMRQNWRSCYDRGKHPLGPTEQR